MIRPPALSVLITLLLALSLPAQILMAGPSPVAPGGTASAALSNNTANNIVVTSSFGSMYERVFNERGEFIRGLPFLFNSWVVQPGQSYLSSFDTSNTPFGTLPDGHYFWEITLSGAGPAALAATFTIGAPANAAPAFFVRFRSGLDIHDDPGTAPFISITNASASAQTFPGASWSLSTLGVGAPAPTSGTFPTINLPAGVTGTLPWPGAPTAGATERLAVTWTDPLAGVLTDVLEATGPVASNGFFPQTAVLHLLSGNTVPSGGALPIFVRSLGSPYCPGACVPLSSAPPLGAAALTFALSPGSIALPGGGTIPLAPDAVFAASLAGTFAPVLLGSPGLTTYPGNAFSIPGSVAPMTLLHPGPQVAGITILAAGVAYFPGAPVWQASAAHPITFQ